MNIPAIADLIARARSDVHFPNVLPWLDLYYQHTSGASLSSTDIRKVETALDELYSRAVMEFSVERSTWGHNLQSGYLLLFPSVSRE